MPGCSQGLWASFGLRQSSGLSSGCRSRWHIPCRCLGGWQGKGRGGRLCVWVFTPRSKQLEVFPGPVAPASPKSGFQPAASPWLLLSRNVSHLLCTFQLEPLYPAVGMCWFQQHSWHQSSFLRPGSETFPKPFKGFGCFETPSFQQ